LNETRTVLAPVFVVWLQWRTGGPPQCVWADLSRQRSSRYCTSGAWELYCE